MGKITSSPTKLQHEQRIWETRSLNGIAVWKFKTFLFERSIGIWGMRSVCPEL